MDLATLSVTFQADIAALQAAITDGQSLLESFAETATGLTTTEFRGDTTQLTAATDEGRGQLTSFKEEAAGLGVVEFRGDTAGLTAATGEARSELAGFKAESEGGANVMFTGDTAGISAAIGEAESELAGFRAAADEEGHVMLTADTAGFNAGIGEAEATMGGFAASAGEMEAGAVGLGAAMGGVGESAGLMGGRMAEAEGATAAAGEEAASAGERFAALTGGVEGLAGGVEGLASTTGLLALAAAFGITGDEVLKSNIQFDRTSTALTTLTGDSDMARQHLEEIEKLGLEGGFSIPGLEAADQKLIATGMHAEDVVPALKNIATATAAVGTGQQGIEQVSDALARMETTGEVTGRTIMALVRNGIPIYQELADVLGTDVNGAMDAVKQHTVDADTVLAAMAENSGRFGDQMAAHASTFEGSVGRIAASIEALSTTAFRPLFDGLTGIGNGIADYLVGIASATSETDAFTAAFGPLAPLVQGAIAVFDAAYAGVTKFWSGVGSLIATLSPLGSALSPVIAQFQAWWPTLEPLVEEIAGPLSAGLIAVAAVLGGVMVASLVATAAGFVGITSTVALVAVAIGGAVVLFTSMYVAISNNATALSVWNTATSVARAGADLIIAGLTLLVQGALAVGTGINSAITWLNNFQGVLPILGSAASSAASAIGSAFSSAYNAVVNWLGQAVAYVRSWGASVVAAVSSVAAPIVAAVQAGWQRVVQITQTVLGPIATVIRYAFLLGEAAILLAYTVISSYVSAGWQQVVSLTQSVLSTVGSIVSDIWNGLVSIISTALAAVEDVVSAGWQFVSDETTSIWTAVQAYLQSWWDWLVGLVTPYVQNIETLIQTGWQYVSDQTTAIWTAIQSFLQTWWDWLVGLVTPYVQNIETLIQTGWQYVSDITNTIWTAIQSFLQGIWDNITSIFNTAVTGLETFLSDAWSSISSTATEGFHTIAHAIVDPMVDAVNTVMDVISSLGTWLANELDSWGVGASIASALRAGAPTHVANPLPFAEGGFRGAGEVNNQSFATGGVASGTPGYADSRQVEWGEDLGPGQREYFLTEKPEHAPRNASLWAEYGQRMGFARGGMMESFASGGTSPDSVQNIFGGPGNADISQVANTGHGATINPTHSFSATQSVNQSPSPSGTAASPAGAAGAALPPGTVGLTLPASAWQSAVSDDAAGNAPALGIDLNITNIQTMPSASSSPIGSAGGATVTDPTATTTPVGSSGSTPGSTPGSTTGSTTGTPSAGVTSTAGGTTAQATGKWYSTTGITSGMVPTGSLRWMPPPPSTSATGTGASGTTPTTGTSGSSTATTPPTGAGIGASGTTPGGVAGSSGAGADTVNIAMPTSMWTAVQADEQSGNTPQLLIDFDPSQVQQLDASGTGSTPTGSTGTAPTSTGTSGSAAPSGGSSGGGRSVLSGTNSGTNTLNQTAGSPTSSNFQNVSLTSNTTSQLRRFATGGFDVGAGEVMNPGDLSHGQLWFSTPGQHAPIPSYGGLNSRVGTPLDRNDARVKDYYKNVRPKFSFAEGGVFDPASMQAAQDWANSQAGSDYMLGYAGPYSDPGYDCAGIADSVIDVLLSGSPSYNKWAGTYDYAGGGAGGLTWSDGTGEVSIGVSLNYGASASDSGDGTHMMINVGGLPVEATSGFGVQTGSTYSGDVTNFDQVMSLSGGTFTPAAGGGGGVSGSALGSALNTGGNAILGDAGAQLAPAGQVGAGLASVVASVGKSVIASVAGKVGGSRAGGVSPGGAAGTGGASGTDPMSLIAADFPADAVQMADTIMERESGGDPSAYNASGASGLFQIMPSTAEGLGGDPSQLFDPAYNVQLAAQLYAQEGWAPWSETAFADGGIVTSPVLGTIGEGGQDEAVIPLPAGAKDFVEKMSHGSGDTAAIARQLADLKATVEKQHAMDRAHGTHITNTDQLAQMGAASAHAALASDAGKETMDKNISQSLGFFNNYLGDTV